jgi:hypothetical protein
MWGERNYPQERQTVFWRAFQKVTDEDFTAAVDELIANHRNPPMLDDLNKAVEITRARSQQARVQTVTGGGVNAVLNSAQDRASYTDPDFVRACRKHLGQFQLKKITQEQFNEGCDRIDELADRLNPRGSQLKHTATAPSWNSGRDRSLGGKDD